MTPTASRRRIECYLRGDTYGTYERQRAIVERVDALESAGVVAEASVDVDWERIRMPEQDARDDAIATYEQFREWAESNGYSLEPAFERRQRAYLGMDAVEEVVVFPVASVAVYEGTDLTAVFPCSGADSEVHFTVGDCLRALESGEAERWLQRFRPLTVDRETPLLDPVGV